ncbi:hypothetical protein PR048_022316 [Dryococelus australis]|uniref:Uncharacterized protein n=1 Tax=Dryococelus australis TaxID=614101 RepID=A0ABQ9H0R5_9NEOP|nr:hypothetical protein PR048_022316 [Dryococelus australis]
MLLAKVECAGRNEEHRNGLGVVVSADTIQNCFAKSGFGKTDGGAEEESLDLEEGWEELKQHGASGDFEEYVHIDDAVSTKTAPLTDHDRKLDNIIPVATCKHREEDENVVSELPGKKEATSALSVLENVLAAGDVDTVILLDPQVVDSTGQQLTAIKRGAKALECNPLNGQESQSLGQQHLLLGRVTGSSTPTTRLDWLLTLTSRR